MLAIHELEPNQSALPVDLDEATRGMDVSPALILRYCAGPRVARAALADSRPPQTPDVSTKHTDIAVLDLEAMWNA